MRMLASFGNWLLQHSTSISIAIVAATLFIFSAPINRFIQRQLKPHGFLVRLALFILICSVGFGLAMAGGVALTDKILHSIDRPLLGPIILLVFVAIGFLAERRHHM